MKPFILVCGAPKTGKSTEVFKTFQNSLAILSAANNVHYYRKILNTKLAQPVVRKVGSVEKTFVYKPPKRIKLIDKHSTNIPKESEPYTWEGLEKPRVVMGRWVEQEVDGERVKILTPDPEGDTVIPTSTIHELEKTVNAVVTASFQARQKGEAPPYDALIIDEWGEFLDRVYSEILPTAVTKKGEEDGRKAFGMLNEWVERFVGWMRQLVQCGVAVCLVTHDREPDAGKKGGVKAPSAGVANKMTGMSDGAVQRIMKDPPYGALGPDKKPLKARRLWKLTASEQWNVGLRGIEPEDEEECAEKELYDVLVQYAGFDL